MSNPSNFLLNTNYPLDKIVFMKEDEWTPSNFDSETGVATGEFQYPTSFGAWNAVIGEWTDDDWVTSYPLGASKYVGGWYRRDSQSLIYEKYSRVTAFGSASGVYVRTNSSYTDKIKFRFYTFIPEQYLDANVNPTASQSNKFVLDTRENYPKLYEDKVIHLQANTPVTYHHNLGFRPFVRAWGGWVGDEYGEGVFEPTCYNIREITTSTITLSATYEDYVYLRIYCDEIE